MKINAQQTLLPRNSIIWLLSSYALIIAAHLYAYLSWWILPIAAVSFIWRLQIHRMKMPFPPVYIKAALIALMVGMLYWTQGNFINTAGFATFFMCLYTLKFIESQYLRDGQVLVLIAYFALCLLFLFETDVWAFAYGLLVFLVTTCALIGLQPLQHGHRASRQIIITSAQLTFWALPLMVLLFIGFPRLPAFLSLPQPQHAQTINQVGLNDRMSPGSISDLMQNDELAFWAEFNQRLPKQHDLYWRAMTLDTFDGKTWSQGMRYQQEAPDYIVTNRNDVQEYNIIYEPTQNRYMVGLDISENIVNSDTQRFALLNDYSLQARREIDQKMRYDLRHIPNVVKEVDLDQDPNKMHYYTRLPRSGNPKTRAWVGQYPTAAQDPEGFVKTIMAHFNQNQFSYTLKPPLLEGDTVDGFMFNSKQGFCEHYASTMTFMLRSANIPSRVVTGYQGGKVDIKNKQIQVRSLDAHAWVEYWVAQKGWIRVDPTSAVAPDRVNNGIDGLFDNDTTNQLGGEKHFYSPVLTQFAQWKTQLNYEWDKRVLGYQSDNQQGLFQQWFGSSGQWRIKSLQYTIITASILLAIALLFFTKPWQTRRFSVATSFSNVLQLLENHCDGFVLQTGLTPKEACLHAQAFLSASEYEVLLTYANAVEVWLYQSNGQSRQQQRTIKKHYRQVLRTLS